MSFEVFTRLNQKHFHSPQVTVTAKRAISLNESACALLGDPSHVVLLHDLDARLIGLRATNERDPNGYRARPHNRRWRQVNAHAFVREVGIPTSTRWDVTLVGDILCVDLNQEPRAVTSNRRAG